VKNKNGMTLIELLAVLVILVIVLIIAAPKIRDLISTSREKIFSTNVTEALNIVTTDFQSNYAGALSIEVTYTFANKSITVNGSPINKAKNIDLVGSITIDNDGRKSLSLKDDNYCAIKSYSDTEISIYDIDNVLCD